METDYNTFNRTTNAADNALGVAGDAVKQAKDKVSDAARKVADTIDSHRVKVAAGLEQTASAMHSGGDKIGQASHEAAKSLESTADYLRQNDLKRMMNDVGTVVKNNPGPSLIVAVAMGFLLGHSLSRRD